MIQGYWGSNEPTKAGFPFDHGIILADAGHEVKIFLIAEAVYLMRRSVADAVVPVGWPPVHEAMEQAMNKGIQIYACHACSRARGMTEEDLAPYKAKWGGPEVLVYLVEWADKIMTL
jgi:predicted peroxiredoxin